MDILSTLLGLVIGAGSAYLILRSKFERQRGVPKQQLDELFDALSIVKTEKARIEGKIATLEKTIEDDRNDLEKERSESKELSASLAALIESVLEVLGCCSMLMLLPIPHHPMNSTKCTRSRFLHRQAHQRR